MSTDDPLNAYLENQVRRHREYLIAHARALGEDLIRLAERFERPEAVVVSELGEIQSRGTMIDAADAQLGR